MLRRFLGHNRLLLLLVIGLLLVPWWQHYAHYLSKADVILLEGLGSEYVLPGRYRGPGIVLLLVAVTVVFSRQLTYFVAAIPILAFWVTWNVAFPQLRSFAPRFYDDNIPSVWLAIWTIGATILLLTYWWPLADNSKKYEQQER